MRRRARNMPLHGWTAPRRSAARTRRATLPTSPTSPHLCAAASHHISASRIFACGTRTRCAHFFTPYAAARARLHAPLHSRRATSFLHAAHGTHSTAAPARRLQASALAALVRAHAAGKTRTTTPAADAQARTARAPHTNAHFTAPAPALHCALPPFALHLPPRRAGAHAPRLCLRTCACRISRTSPLPATLCHFHFRTRELL